jgi:hypothetical protein
MREILSYEHLLFPSPVETEDRIISVDSPRDHIWNPKTTRIEPEEEKSCKMKPTDR